MEKDGYVYYSVVMGGEETEVNGQWVQGDFLDTLNLLKLTDDFKPHAFKPVTVIIAAVIAALALAAGLVLLKRRK